MQEKKFDVIVIGGGIVGVSAAYYLAQRGALVALVEQNRIGSGTTARSFAWINASSKVGDESYHRLNALGAALHKELAVLLGDDRLGLHRTGMLQCINRSDVSGHAAMREQAGYLTAYGYDHRVLDAPELSRMEPAVVFADDATALHVASEDWLDAPVFAQTLAGELEAAGCTILEDTSARELAMTGDGTITGVITDQGVLRAGKVLLATGHETPAVLAQLTGHDAFASRFPMNQVPGLLVTIPDEGRRERLGHVIYFDEPANPFHIRPAPNGGLRMGADDTDGMLEGDSSQAGINRAAEALLARARARLPGLIGDVTVDQCDLAIGVRPYPHDGKTLAGAMPGSPGLYLVATHSGITLAPALGSLMAELILDGSTPGALRPFALERFPGFA